PATRLGEGGRDRCRRPGRGPRRVRAAGGAAARGRPGTVEAAWARAGVVALLRVQDREILHQPLELLSLPRDDDREVEGRDEDEEHQRPEEHGRWVVDVEPARDGVEAFAAEREHQQSEGEDDPDERILLGQSSTAYEL